jgi:hypothetical protein
MGDREDKINREIEKERRRIEEWGYEIERLLRKIDRDLAEGFTSNIGYYRSLIRDYRKKIEIEKKHIEGKELVRDKGGDETTKELIKNEQDELNKDREERDRLLNKEELTPEDKRRLEELHKKIVEAGYKLEGKERAGRVVDEFKLAYLDPSKYEMPGPYKMTIFDPWNREIAAILLPNPLLEQSMGDEGLDKYIDDEEMLDQFPIKDKIFKPKPVSRQQRV